MCVIPMAEKLTSFPSSFLQQLGYIWRNGFWLAVGRLSVQWAENKWNSGHNDPSTNFGDPKEQPGLLQSIHRTVKYANDMWMTCEWLKSCVFFFRIYMDVWWLYVPVFSWWRVKHAKQTLRICYTMLTCKIPWWSVWCVQLGTPSNA